MPIISKQTKQTRSPGQERNAQNMIDEESNEQDTAVETSEPNNGGDQVPDGQVQQQGRLEGTVALIRGGNSVIGKETARLFLSHGATVIISGTKGTRDEELAEVPKAIHVEWDVKEKEIENKIKAATNLAGKLDIMVNNAEFLVDSTKSGDEDGMQAFDHAMNKVKKVMHGFEHASSFMKPKGCIISTACIEGIAGQSTPLAYTASKHAVIGLTKNVAAHLRQHGIRVNCVSSDGSKTGNVDSVGNNSVSVEHIAEAVLFLASKEAEYVSGLNLVVDGAFTVANHI